jgi:hypothetical protein
MAATPLPSFMRLFPPSSEFRGGNIVTSSNEAVWISTNATQKFAAVLHILSRDNDKVIGYTGGVGSLQAPQTMWNDDDGIMSSFSSFIGQQQQQQSSLQVVSLLDLLRQALREGGETGYKCRHHVRDQIAVAIWCLFVAVWIIVPALQIIWRSHKNKASSEYKSSRRQEKLNQHLKDFSKVSQFVPLFYVMVLRNVACGVA